MEITTIAIQILTLTQAFKSMGLPTKFLPLVAIVMGAVVNVLNKGLFDSNTVFEGFIYGVTVTYSYDLIDNKIVEPIDLYMRKN